MPGPGWNFSETKYSSLYLLPPGSVQTLLPQLYLYLYRQSSLHPYEISFGVSTTICQGKMSGYSAPYIGLPDPEKAVVTLQTSDEYPTLAERRGKSWYKNLSLSTRSRDKSGHSSILATSLQPPAKLQQEYLNNKPLPPLPSPLQPPYFEYMFADAGIKTMKSSESMKSSTEANSETSGKRAVNSFRIFF